MITALAAGAMLVVGLLSLPRWVGIQLERMLNRRGRR